MRQARRVFRFLCDAAARAEATALVTITAVIGHGSRRIGDHFGVSETGAFAGSLSGGCLDAAVIAEAQRLMRDGRAEILRFGAGSPFLDIRLPCGGGLDLLVTPNPPVQLLAEAARRLDARQPVAFALPAAGGVALADERVWHSADWAGDVFYAPHRPDLRLIIAGQGAETPALARLAQAAAVDCLVLTPDAAVRSDMARLGVPCADLARGRAPLGALDALTAVVTLFHDHVLEIDSLAQALAETPLFVGAMGSRETQRLRLAALEARGVSRERRAVLVGPIGLIPGARDPETLALSVLAQVAACYEAAIAQPSYPDVVQLKDDVDVLRSPPLATEPNGRRHGDNGCCNNHGGGAGRTGGDDRANGAGPDGCDARRKRREPRVAA